MVAIVAIATAACAAWSEDVDQSEDAITDVPSKKERLDPVDEDGLYHWSEGSEFLPYFAVRAMKVLERDANGEPTGNETSEYLLSENNLARYGFIPDRRDASRRIAGKIPNDSMPDGSPSLPIGMTLARAPDTGLVSVGVNCASCHVGQIEVNGTRRVINGVPNMFEVSRFFGEVIQTLDYIANKGGPLLKAKYAARLVREAARTKSTFSDLEDEVLGTRDSATDHVDMLFKLVGKRQDFDTFVNGLDASAERKALLRSRKTFFDGLVARLDLAKESTAGGFGRTDAFGTAKNMIFFGHGFMRATHAPMSFPSMLNMETVDLFHANGNTNSVLQRNMGQSIGLGAVFAVVDGRDKKIVASSHLTNLLRLEHSIYKIAPPAWPARRDEAAASRGETIYKRECRSCHEPAPLETGLYKSKTFPLSEVGTDPLQVLSLGEHIVPNSGPESGNDLGHIFSVTGPVFVGIESWYRQAHRGELEREERAYSSSSPAAAKIAEARATPWWRATNEESDHVYVARPLDGVWATAPFLHNGSVPTLYDLLRPAKDRPRAFCVGHRGYDLDKVGYKLLEPTNGKCPAGDSLLDTNDAQASLKGNSNKGHEFGTEMSEADKRDLIEFLKGFGAGKSRPTVFE